LLTKVNVTQQKQTTQEENTSKLKQKTTKLNLNKHTN